MALAFDGSEKDVNDLQVTGDRWTGWHIKDIERFHPALDWIFSLVGLGSSPSGGFRLELHLRNPERRAPDHERECSELVGHLFPSSDYLNRFSVGDKSHFNVTAQVGEMETRLLLSPRFSYDVRYHVGKIQKTRTESTSEITYYRREPNPWTNGLDGQAMFALATLTLFCLQALFGLAMLRILEVRKGLVCNEPERNTPIFESSSSQGDAQHGTMPWLQSWQKRREEKAEVRGYHLHLAYLVIPSVTLVLLLGGALSMHREMGTWGVLGCPGTEVLDGAPGVAVKCALGWHIISWVLCTLAELFDGGQSYYRIIAKTPEECEMKLEELYGNILTLQMKGTAYHTEGTGKQRRTVNSFEGTRDVVISGQQDISQRIDGHVLRGPPLVCIKVELEVRYASPEAKEAVDAQYSAWVEEVGQKDSNRCTSLDPIVAGLDYGYTRLAAINRSHSILKAFSCCFPFADLICCGWGARMLMEFWTVHVNLKIVKEVQVGALALVPTVVRNTLQDTVQGIWGSIQGALGQQPTENQA